MLIVVSLYPGSLFGFVFYGDLGQQPNIIKNPFGTTINHFIAYIYLGLLGFSIYLREKNFQKWDRFQTNKCLSCKNTKFSETTRQSEGVAICVNTQRNHWKNQTHYKFHEKKNQRIRWIKKRVKGIICGQ